MDNLLLPRYTFIGSYTSQEHIPGYKDLLPCLCYTFLGPYWSETNLNAHPSSSTVLSYMSWILYWSQTYFNNQVSLSIVWINIFLFTGHNSVIVVPKRLIIIYWYFSKTQNYWYGQNLVDDVIDFYRYSIKSQFLCYIDYLNWYLS